MEYLINLVLLFFIFSLVGWCIEVTLKYRQFHRFINRGFFVGPLLPIYGTGAVLITVSVSALSSVDSSVGTTFVTSFFVCGFIEYLASFFMEKKYHARWWDYSQKPMNLKGRVWIGNLILFGLGGILIYEIIDPVLLPALSSLSMLVREIVAGVLSAIFIADFIVSYFVMKLVKEGVESSEADNTEAISKEVRMLLSNKSVFYRRFADAYPEVIYKTEKIAKRLEDIKVESEKIRQEAEARIDDINKKLGDSKEYIMESLESSGSIKNGIIQKQDELIILLSDGVTLSDEGKTLMKEIEEKKARLNSKILK